MPLDGRLRPRPGAPARELQARLGQDGTLHIPNRDPGLRYQVTNLSTASTAWIRARDGYDVDGSRPLRDVMHGDVVRVQARDQHGNVVAATNLRAEMGGQDNRAAYVALDRVRVREGADGVIRIGTRGALTVSEPEATVRFTNPDNAAFLDVQVDRLGRLPTVDATALGLRPGDEVMVAASDGEGNTDFAWAAGKITVAADERDGPNVPGTLFGEVIDPEDGKQGSLGNCPMPAGAMAVAAADPQLVKHLIADNGDGTYTVTLRPPGQKTRDIVVDGELHSRYGKANQKDANGNPINWFPLVEKAYAELVGGYDIMGQGLSVGDVIATLSGRKNTAYFHNVTDADKVWGELVDGYKNQRVMAAGTHPSAAGVNYSGSGVYANHAYSILSVREENGQRLLTLRNPWGSSDGRVLPSDGENDGVFDIPLESYLELYQVTNVC